MRYVLLIDENFQAIKIYLGVLKVDCMLCHNDNWKLILIYYASVYVDKSKVAQTICG